MGHNINKTIENETTLRKILSEGKYTSLALNDGNEPYIVTLSYGLDPKTDTLYFHTPKTGLKINFLKSNPYVCGTVIQDDGYEYGACTHHFHSILYWGVLEVVHNIDEKKHALNSMIDQLEDDGETLKDRFSTKETLFDNIYIMKLDIERMTGKSNPGHE